MIHYINYCLNSLKLYHIHKWIELPISTPLFRRCVLARRRCEKCGRTFIKKNFYKGWFGILKWMETFCSSCITGRFLCPLSYKGIDKEDVNCMVFDCKQYKSY